MVSGMGRSLGKLTDDEKKVNITKANSGKVQALRDGVAARVKAGEALATLKSPFVGLMTMRVTKAGKLRTVGILNTRIGEQEEIMVALRGISEGAKVIWCEAGKAPIELSVKNGEVIIPSIDAWNCGFLDIQ